jgi:hypothetical protein
MPGGLPGQFEESKHPREHGKFAGKPGSGAGVAGYDDGDRRAVAAELRKRGIGTSIADGLESSASGAGTHSVDFEAIDAAVLGTDGPTRAGLQTVNDWGQRGVASLSADPGTGPDARKALRRAVEMNADAEFAGVNLSRAGAAERSGPHGPAIVAAESVVARVRTQAPGAIGRAATAAAADLPDRTPGPVARAIRFDPAELPAAASDGILAVAAKGRVQAGHPGAAGAGNVYVDADSPAGKLLWAASGKGDFLPFRRVKLRPGRVTPSILD